MRKIRLWAYATRTGALVARIVEHKIAAKICPNCVRNKVFHTTFHICTIAIAFFVL
jgi:hypothetical protein